MTPQPEAAATGTASTPDKRILAADPNVFAGNGWYWNPSEGGTGFMFEAQGSRGFVAFFMYDATTGNPTWYAAYGDIVRNASTGAFNFAGDLRVYQGGQAVSAGVYTGPTSTSVGSVSIGFLAGKADVSLPGGRTIAAQRYVIDNSGYDFANPSVTRAVQPEVGWYWNPAEGGRGYAIEVQNDKVFMAMFHYNPDGSPTWNVVQGDMTSGTAIQRFELYTGGQALGSAYKGPTKADLLPFTLTFRNACAGQLQMYGAPPINLRRFSIDGTTQAAGSECRATATLADIAEVGSSEAMQPGDSVFGMIDRSGDVDGYKIQLVAGTTYTFDLRGAASKSGTLGDPLLILADYDRGVPKLAENDDRDATSTESRITYTAATSGTYYLQAKASGSGTGSYLLTSSGVAAGLGSFPAAAASSYAGTASGRLRGSLPGSASLTISASGDITGDLRFDATPDQPVALTGKLTAGGSVVISTGAPRNISCTAFVAGTGFFGSCGTAGMLEGSWTPTTIKTGTLGVVLQCLASGTKLKLVVNGANPLTVTGDGSCTGRPFFFGTKVAYGDSYEISVASQPSGPDQFCRFVSNGAKGVFSGDIAVAQVNCFPVDQSRTVGGTVTGLKGSGMVLKRACLANEVCAGGGKELAVAANGPFTFTGLKSGDAYSISVSTAPTTPQQTCSVQNGTGTVLDNVANVAISCTDTPAFFVGGLISGLTGTGLVLGQGSERLQVAANGNGQFSFAVPVANGISYTATVLNQPSNPAQLCSVAGGTGTVTGAKIESVLVTCAAVPPKTYTVGGVVAGLVGSGLVLVNDGVDLTVVNGNFTLPFTFAPASRYNITVKTQPSDQVCTVVNGAGTVDAANVSNVTVTCPALQPAISVANSILKLKANQTINLLVTVVNPPASGAPFTATSPQRCAQIGTTSSTLQLIGRVTPSGHCREDVTITSGSASKTLTVNVYDPGTMDIGDGLLIRYETAYDFKWNDSGSGASFSGAFWTPKNDSANGWFAIGGYVLNDYSDPNKNTPIIMVKDTSTSQDLLVNPVSMVAIWNTSGMRSSVQFGTVWKPICPSGYKALGSVFWGSGTPPLNAIKCVAVRFTTQATLGTQQYTDVGTRADANLSVWNVGPPLVGVKDGYAPMAALALVGCSGSYDGSGCDLSTLNQLLIPMTVADRSSDLGQEPQLTGYFPLQNLSKRFSARVRIPFTMIPSEAPKCGIPVCATAAERVANNVLVTPFYYLSREESYVHVDATRNNLATVQPWGPYTESLGWNEQSATTYGVTVGLEVSAELAFTGGSKVGSKLTSQFSWSQMSTTGTNGTRSWQYGPYSLTPGIFVELLKVTSVFRAISEDDIALPTTLGGSTTGSMLLQWPLPNK